MESHDFTCTLVYNAIIECIILIFKFCHVSFTLKTDGIFPRCPNHLPVFHPAASIRRYVVQVSLRICFIFYTRPTVETLAKKKKCRIGWVEVDGWLVGVDITAIRTMMQTDNTNIKHKITFAHTSVTIATNQQHVGLLEASGLMIYLKIHLK